MFKRKLGQKLKATVVWGFVVWVVSGVFFIFFHLVGGIFLKFLIEHPFNDAVLCLLTCGFHEIDIGGIGFKKFPSSGETVRIISIFKTVESFFRRRT